jgi:hypothetical protein
LLDDTNKFKSVDDLINSFITDNLSTCEDDVKQFVIGFLKQVRALTHRKYQKYNRKTLNRGKYETVRWQKFRCRE